MQAAYCRARTARDIVLKPRQVGFTTIELARDLWMFLTKPGARVVVVVQSMSDDSAIKEVSEKLIMMIRSLREAGIDLPFATETATMWRLPALDSSLKIIGAGASEAAASKKGRSGTITRLHLSEVAFFEFAKTTLNAILECVPGPEHGTEIVIESTPNGAAGVFFERYKAAAAGASGYKAHFYPWHEQAEYVSALEPGEQLEPPHTTRERELVDKHHVTQPQLKWYRQKVSEKKQDLVDQEYPTDSESCWLIAGATFFDKAKTAELLAKCRPPIAIELGGALHIWEQPRAGVVYVVAADPSEGTGGDPGAAIVLERATGKHVATVWGQFTPWPFGEMLVTVARLFGNALIVVERNNHGHAVLQSILHGQKYQTVYVAPDGKYGWNNSEVTRAAALDAIEEAHRRGVWASPDARVIGEQRTFINHPKTGKAEAAKGAHDDLILASTIGWDVIRKPTARRRDFANLPPA